MEAQDLPNNWTADATSVDAWFTPEATIIRPGSEFSLQGLTFSEAQRQRWQIDEFWTQFYNSPGCTRFLLFRATSHRTPSAATAFLHDFENIDRDLIGGQSMERQVLGVGDEGYFLKSQGQGVTQFYAAFARASVVVEIIARVCDERADPDDVRSFAEALDGRARAIVGI